MGHRLSKIYTRTGDDGMTGLGGGVRVAKFDILIETTGTVDETSSAIALVLAEADLPDAIRSSLRRIQNELFEVGGELAMPGYRGITAQDVVRLESELDALNENLPPLKEFVLPGGDRAAAACHLARAVCRRAERNAWNLAQRAQPNPQLLRYLNRLSDYLFVAARVLARRHGAAETLWQRR